jgi:hypothetical protein
VLLDEAAVVYPLAGLKRETAALLGFWKTLFILREIRFQQDYSVFWINPFDFLIDCYRIDFFLLLISPL